MQKLALFVVGATIALLLVLQDTPRPERAAPVTTRTAAPGRASPALEPPSGAGADAVPERAVPLPAPQPEAEPEAEPEPVAAATALHIVDATDGRELVDVEVVRLVADWIHDEEIHPGTAATEPVATNARSPLSLSGTQPTTYWIRAPGYAWARMSIAHDSGGARIVRLSPGGALLLEVHNFQCGEIRFHPYLGGIGKPLLTVTPGEDGRLLIESLAPGEYTVEGAINEWWSDRRVSLGRGDVEVRAGERATLVLHLEDLPARQEAPLAGTIEIPEAWGDPYVSLSLRPIEATAQAAIKHMKLRPLGDGLYAWDAGGVQRGRYLAELYPFYLQAVVEAGSRDIRLRVPPPADVVVNVLDPDREAPIDGVDVSWHMKGPRESTGGGLGSAERDEGTGRFSARCPAGQIVLSVRGRGVTLREERTVRPGRNEFTFRVRPRCGVRVVLKEGAATVPWDEGFLVTGERSDGEGSARTQTYSGTSRTLWFDEPGEYVLRFGRMPGYRRVPDRTVAVERGEVRTVEIPLER